MRRQIITIICTTSDKRRMNLPQQDDTSSGETSMAAVAGELQESCNPFCAEKQ